MALANTKKMPPFCLAFFSDFRGVEPSKAPDTELALVSPNFVLLAPIEIDGGFQGTMLAQIDVSGQQVECEWMGTTITVQVPEFNDFVIAKNNIEIDVVMPLS